MSDYQESTISGSKYRRWRRIVIEHPRDAVPSALIVEDEVIVLDDEAIERAVANLHITMSDPAKTIPLRDPTTGWTETGTTMTMGELYAAIGSACWQAALERDAAQTE
jgi:hypothetical protein